MCILTDSVHEPPESVICDSQDLSNVSLILNGISSFYFLILLFFKTMGIILDKMLLEHFKTHGHVEILLIPNC